MGVNYSKCVAVSAKALQAPLKPERDIPAGYWLEVPFVIPAALPGPSMDTADDPQERTGCAP